MYSSLKADFAAPNTRETATGISPLPSPHRGRVVQLSLARKCSQINGCARVVGRLGAPDLHVFLTAHGSALRLTSFSTKTWRSGPPSNVRTGSKNQMLSQLAVLQWQFGPRQHAHTQHL